jgi:glucose-6-phosphate isomerase
MEQAKMNARDLWNRYEAHLCRVPSVGLSLDISRMQFDDSFLATMAPAMEKAYTAMDELEKGKIANPDEKRMVGHYWLRAPDLAPTAEISKEIRGALGSIKAFAAKVHAGEVKPQTAGRFTQMLSIGIGGSALGPMFVSDALGNHGKDKMKPHFIDNTDPDGIARVLATLGSSLAVTLVVVMSKSGSTPEPRNGMMVVADAYREKELDFAPPRCRGDRRGIRAGPTSHRTRLAGAVSHVGLGRRPNQ